MPFGLKKRRYLKTSWIREKQWSSMTKVSYVHLRSPNFKLFHMLSIPLPPPSLERCFKMYPFLNSTYPLPFPLVLPTILSHCNYYYFDHIFASNIFHSQTQRAIHAHFLSLVLLFSVTITYHKVTSPQPTPNRHISSQACQRALNCHTQQPFLEGIPPDLFVTLCIVIFPSHSCSNPCLDFWISPSKSSFTLLASPSQIPHGLCFLCIFTKCRCHAAWPQNLFAAPSIKRWNAFPPP